MTSALRNSRPDPGREEPEIEEAFDRLVGEGSDRLARPWPSLLATGFLGGVDVGVGVLAALTVERATGDKLVAALAFSIGFIALLLARSELFTENFLVPVIAAVARPGHWTQLLRLWVVSLATNLAGGLVMAAITMAALPDLHEVAISTGTHYARLGVSWRSFWLAVLAGVVITLLTRMQHASDDLLVKLVPAVVMPFVLVGGQLFHSVLDSIFMFAGLCTNAAPYSWWDWLAALGWSSLGNMVGGLTLVTGIRALRVTHRLAEERDDAH
ncbi:MAG: formate/nitrite transporter family protein [Jatrophihabitans sp.]|uniref:formate/nitrite transporter family protein n=1 Tax=Jatrophihabitans sp. TaxID=1932789 RepID=UPI003F7F1BED